MYRVYLNKNGRKTLPKSRRIPGTFRTENIVDPTYAIVSNTVRIGEGMEGTVSAGFTNNAMKNLVAIKNFFENQNGIPPDVYFSNKLSKIVPLHVPHIRSYNKNEARMVSNMYRGGSTLDWLKEYDPDENLMRSLILQVLGSLYEIHKKDPSFRHFDLHLGNVFLDDRYVSNKPEKLYRHTVPYYGVRAIIADFGYAVDSEMGMRMIDKNYGIVPGADKMYDAHFFMNALIFNLKSKSGLTETKKFLFKYVPESYRGFTSTHVQNSRLKPGHKYPFTFEQLLNDEFFGKKDTVKESMRKYIARGGAPARMTAYLKNLYTSAEIAAALRKTRSPAKKARVVLTPPKGSVKKPRVVFSKANKERMAVRKIELVRRGMNNVQAELKAIRNIETLKTAGLLTPSPTKSPKGPMMLGPAAREAAGNLQKKNLTEFVRKMNVAVIRPEAKKMTGPAPAPVSQFVRSPGGRLRISGRLCMSYKKDQLVEFAKKAGVDTTGTKEALCGRIAPLKNNLRNKVKTFIDRFPAGQTLTLRKIREHFKNVPKNQLKPIVKNLTIPVNK